jgi:hypothetical protein
MQEMKKNKTQNKKKNKGATAFFFVASACIDGSAVYSTIK